MQTRRPPLPSPPVLSSRELSVASLHLFTVAAGGHSVGHCSREEAAFRLRSAYAVTWF